MDKEERKQVLGPMRKYEINAPIRTGRTTRMMEEVLGHLAEGKTVWVVCATKDHALSLKYHYLERIQKLPGTAHFEGVTSMGPHWDWHTLTSHRVCSDDIVLVDTWAIESPFMRMLNMLHRWDPEEEECWPQPPN